MKIRFGLAFETAALLPKKLPEEFELLEFAGSWLESEENCRKVRKYPIGERIIRDLYTGSLCRLLPGEKLALRLDFGEYLRQTTRRAQELGIQLGSGAFDLETALHDREYAAHLRSILSSCYRDWLESNWTLLLPLRLPGTDTAAAARFHRELGFDRIRWSVELYPHEPGFPALSPAACWPDLAFRAEVLHFHYEPEIGNHLTGKLLLPWLQRAAVGGEELKVVLVPDHLAAENSQRRIAELAELVKEVRSALC